MPNQTSTQATGTFFMARSRPVISRALDGTFQFTLLLMDRLSTHSVEPWRVAWSGPVAEAWWQAHGAQLQPGAPLRVCLGHIRSHAGGRAGAEIHARITQAPDVLPSNSTTDSERKPAYASM